MADDKAKRSPGRPHLPKDKKRVRLNLRIEQESFEYLSRIAESVPSDVPDKYRNVGRAIDMIVKRLKDISQAKHLN